MNKRIIYKNTSGGVSVIIPADCGLTIEEIAAKDVPFRDVFTQTGAEVLTQEAYDQNPQHWDDKGYAVGDSYPIGTWSRERHPYKIVDVADIPTDRTERDLWEVDEADLTDGVGA